MKALRSVFHAEVVNAAASLCKLLTESLEKFLKGIGKVTSNDSTTCKKSLQRDIDNNTVHLVRSLSSTVQTIINYRYYKTGTKCTHTVHKISTHKTHTSTAEKQQLTDKSHKLRSVLSDTGFRTVWGWGTRLHRQRSIIQTKWDRE